MSVSLSIISVIILLIMFGAGQRILDGLRMSDKEALVVLVLICVGLVIPPIWIGEYFCFSIGGFLLPFAISIYLLISCGWSRDLIRVVVGTILVAGLIYLCEWLLPADPESVVVDNMFVYGIIAGVVAYMLGRSRRNAFVSCLFGITLAQMIQWLINFGLKIPTILGLGVGGAFGTYVVAILVSVAVAEFLGRCFESAKPDDYKKEFNFETHVYDSEKNGNLKEEKNSSNNRKKDIGLLKNAKNKQNNKKSSKNNAVNGKLSKESN